jgi:hypothetical protein
MPEFSEVNSIHIIRVRVMDKVIIVVDLRKEEVSWDFLRVSNGP